MAKQEVKTKTMVTNMKHNVIRSVKLNDHIIWYHTDISFCPNYLEQSPSICSFMENNGDETSSG